MKHHLLGLAILAVTASVTITRSAYAQEAKESDRTNSISVEDQSNASSSVGTILLNAESSFQEVIAVDASGRLATHRFELKLPEGATLHAALPSDTDKSIMLGEIFVQDKNGQVIGVIDAAWAQDANGQPLLTYFTIDGQTLVQTVDTSKAEQAATVTLTYTGSSSQTAAEAGVSTRAYVGIPSNYVYNPRLGSLHDYCTSSPDSFGTANFRGPCARHDMCYQAHTAGKRTCDNRLWTDLRSNCEVAYAWYNPVRVSCYNTANIYWAAVTAFGGY